MTLEKTIHYSSATLNPESELEKLDNDSKISLKPRDEDGNPLAALVHFNETNYDTTYKVARTFLDSAYARNMFCEGFTNWWTDNKKFGTAAARLGQLEAGGAKLGGAVFPFINGLNNMDEFSIQAQVYFLDVNAGTFGIFQEFSGYSSPLQGGRWWFARQGTELKLVTFDKDNPQTCHTLITSGLSLQTGQWYQITVSYKKTEQAARARIYLDAQKVAETDEAKQMKSFGENEAGRLGVGGAYYSDIQIRAFTCNCYMDELIVWPKEIAPAQVRTQALKPFSATEPKAYVTLDAGFKSAVWDASSLSFFNESDFQNNGIKIRWDADEDDTPEFEGSSITLSEFRAGDDPVGRYLHFEFSFSSDGDTQRTLHSGSIQLRFGKPGIIARTKPEIVRR